MNDLEMPPFPLPGTSGPQVCEAVRFYLPLVDELPFEQVRILSEHVKGCPACAQEFQRIQQATRLLAEMPTSAPSVRVDQAIHALLRAQTPPQKKMRPAPELSWTLATGSQPVSRPLPSKQPVNLRVQRSQRRIRTLALVAALLLALGLGGFFLRGLLFSGSTQTAFALPANLSWSGYVLHYVQTRYDAHGHAYQVEVYQDLGTNQMHIESTMKGKFDVVVIMDQQENMLGEDMMHHVAQKGSGVESWTVDGSTFDLTQLRQDLNMQHATYLGQSTFQNQSVYQVRTSNGQILLLNMQYMPVNVLSASTPLYSTCALLPAAQVDDSMWDMHVPSGFHMGKLPSAT